MSHVLLRTRALLAAGALTLPLIFIPVPAVSAVTVTPVEVITEDPFADPVPLDHRTDVLLDRAEDRALASPDVYATPYVEYGQLVAPVVNPARQLEASVLMVPRVLPPVPDDGTDDESAVPPPDELEKPADPPPAAAGLSASEAKTSPEAKASPSSASEGELVAEIVDAPVVRYSLTRLEEIKDEVLELAPEVLPGADKLISAAVHAERNRVVVEATEAPDALRTALAVRYGSDAVTILLVPDPGPIVAHNRQRDTSPFYGGARIEASEGNCTSGFSWRVGTVPYMLTAGHCTASNSRVYTPVTQIGTVVKDNWDNGIGTVKIDGQSGYYGDLALVKVVSGASSAGRMYIGNKDSGSSRAVAGMASRKSRRGDTFCIGGMKTGALCGWKVTHVAQNVRYGKKIGRNLVKSNKTGTCPVGGDSGAPAYTLNSKGRVVAKGIYSGGGGSGTKLNPCRAYFTDIRDAYVAMPGIIATG
ncbi:S1 family peptidase [Rhizohabitans arisaemae]|uniref:S1 family peptidase n=1 Tax=Rhizohabitans arisaemae TaxID=2720610 RepID=UPI0024B05A69|nr:S1 family peptidase [Rhizohabitans arisaemae]